MFSITKHSVIWPSLNSVATGAIRDFGLHHERLLVYVIKPNFRKYLSNTNKFN